MKQYKMRNPMTGKYELVSAKIDTMKRPLGYTNGRPLNMTISDVEVMNVTADKKVVKESS